MISSARLADVLVEVADTLVDDYDVVDLLQSLTDHAAAVSDADAVGLVLADHRGILRFMTASNASGRALELFQLQHEEGPCRDCFTSGTPVVNADLGAAEAVWPTFAPLAREAGFRSVHAFPVRLRERRLGALNLFSREHQSFAEAEVRLVQSLADVATIAILQEQSVTRAEALTEQLQGALNSRIVVEQAKGALAQREGIEVDEAFVRMRQQARARRVRLSEVAAEVLRRA